MAKMNKEWKAKWVSALRSDRYQQDTGYLRTDDGYCCLGVLCDLVDPQGWERHPGLCWDHTGGQGVLPGGVIEVAGIQPATPDPIIGGVKLSALNDSGEWSFDQLADLIEREL
jgi:hypothetical protein